LAALMAGKVATSIQLVPSVDLFILNPALPCADGLRAMNSKVEQMVSCSRGVPSRFPAVPAETWAQWLP
jgi:hypothetical protein